MRYFRFISWICALFLVACDTHEISRPADDYFPLKKGLYHIYDVEEINFTLGEPETLHYQLKTMITDSVQSDNGQFIHILSRWRKMDGEVSWNPIETWSIRKTSSEVIVSEGNVLFVVMTLPTAKDNEWNGNKYNNLINPTTKRNEDLYAITKKGETANLSTGLSFRDCIEILQEDNQEFIVFLDQRREVYAAGVGLIQRERVGLQYCNDQDRNCVGQRIVDEGSITKQELVEYGQD